MTNNKNNTNNTINNINKEENNMNNIISNPNLTTGTNFGVSALKSGHNVCIPTIDGREVPQLAFCYCSESDKEKALKFIEKAAQSCNGNMIEMMYNITQFFTMATEGYGDVVTKEDEIINIDDKEYIISYKERKLYNQFGQEIYNLDEFEDEELSDKMVKKLLMKLLEG